MSEGALVTRVVLTKQDLVIHSCPEVSWFEEVYRVKIRHIHSPCVRLCTFTPILLQDQVLVLHHTHHS